MNNTLKLVLRNFIRKPVTNSINLIGLSVSLALVIILSVYSYSELTTDHFQKKGNRVFMYGQLDSHIYTPGVLKDQIDLNIPEIETSVRITGTWDNPVFQAGNKEPLVSDLIFSDKGFFKLFTYKALEGNLDIALEKPMSVVITKALSNKLFGKEQAFGKMIKLDNNHELTVTAVIKESGKNSCLSFNALTSMDSRKIIESSNLGEFSEWGWNNFQTFLLLKRGADIKESAKKIAKLYPDCFQEDISNNILIPFKKLYFSKLELYGNKYLQCGDKRKILILLLVASMVLIIALINFINISSSQWLGNIRQTGVLKVLGVKRSGILHGLLTESLILFLLALLLAVIIIRIVYPFVQDFTGIHFNYNLLQTPGFLFLSLAGTLLLSSLFSMIPAIQISSSKAVNNLKNKVKSRSAKGSSRGILVTMQFTIAIILIAFTLLVQKQVNYGSNNLGFKQENIIGIKLTPQLGDKKNVLKKLLQENVKVKDISMGQFFPGKEISNWGTNLEIEGKKKEVFFDTFSADTEFFKMMGFELKQGRFFSDNLVSEAGKMVVNESFVRENKISNPIGTFLPVGNGGSPKEIVGVIKDFHYKSYNQPIAPLVIRNDSYTSYCLVNMQTSDFKSLRSSIDEIKAAASEISPAFPVEISFFDQAVENMYKSELMFRKTFTLFSLCAIVICCLGILAMSLFACQRRTKEIGIRKVNGAKISEVLLLLNEDFVRWVVIAFIIAVPIAYYAMNKWLEGFAYKTELSWWIFAIAGLLALGIALVTVSFQSWKAATRNPVESLRNE